jgi:hypothetical protein
MGIKLRGAGLEGEAARGGPWAPSSGAPATMRKRQTECGVAEFWFSEIRITPALRDARCQIRCWCVRFRGWGGSPCAEESRACMAFPLPPNAHPENAVCACFAAAERGQAMRHHFSSLAAPTYSAPSLGKRRRTRCGSWSDGGPPRAKKRPSAFPPPNLGAGSERPPKWPLSLVDLADAAHMRVSRGLREKLGGGKEGGGARCE